MKDFSCKCKTDVVYTITTPVQHSYLNSLEVCSTGKQIDVQNTHFSQKQSLLSHVPINSWGKDMVNSYN